MKTTLFILGGLMIAGTLLPLSKKDNWWIRSFDFPRLQITFFILFVIIAYLPFIADSLLVDLIFLILLFLCLLYQSYMMFPYTKFAQKQVQTSTKTTQDTISLLFANVQMENRNSEKLKKIIDDTDPDIILTVEVNKWWLKKLNELEQNYAHTVYYPQDNHYGMALFSKFELINPQVKFLIETHIPSIHVQARLSSGKRITLRCLHPEPPFINAEDKSADRDAELLIIGRELKQSNEPAIVFGDLNDVAWSHTNNLFQDISGLLDGFYNTFHAKYPFLRFPLDHAFHTSHFRLVDFRRLSYFSSDHFPVYIEVSYEPEAENEQDKLQADVIEKEEADEKVEAVMV